MLVAHVAVDAIGQEHIMLHPPWHGTPPEINANDSETNVLVLRVLVSCLYDRGHRRHSSCFGSVAQQESSEQAPPHLVPLTSDVQDADGVVA